MKRLGSQRGFNLVELSVVLSLVGILSVLAIPTFKDARDKGRQAEAKVNLNGIYSGMKMFYGNWMQYFGDFRNIGFELKGELRYRIGFHWGSGGPSKDAPANYVGPGAQAGTNAVEVNSNPGLGHCGPTRQCEEVSGQIAGFNPPGYSTGWGVDTATGDHWFLTGAGSRLMHRPPGQQRQFIMLDQDKNFYMVNY